MEICTRVGDPGAEIKAAYNSNVIVRREWLQRCVYEAEIEVEPRRLGQSTATIKCDENGAGVSK